MKKMCIILWVVIAANCIIAQNILSWKNYTDMKNVTSVGSNNNLYFASSSGGMFIYDSNDQSYITITKVEGLSSHNITSLSLDPDGKVWMGAIEGVINVYDIENGGEVTRILDIFNSDKNQKQINHLMAFGNSVYVSTNFGISIIDKNSLSFSETILRFGNFPAEAKVNSTYYNSKVYIALDAGVAVQKDNVQNLSAPESWESYDVTSIGNATVVNAVSVFNNRLYAATDRGLYSLENGSWNLSLFGDENVVDLAVDNNSIFLLLDHSLYQFDGTNSTRLFINNETYLTDINLTDDSNFLLSSDTGLWKIGDGEPERFYPNGPASNSFQSLTVDTDGNLWSGTGRDVFGVGIMKFNGTDWAIFNTANTPELGTNAMHLVKSFSDSSTYMMNWGSGYTKFQNGTFERFDENNTSMIGIPGSPDFLVVTGIQKDSRGNLWVLSLRSENRNHLNILTTDGIWYHYSIDDPYLGSNQDAEHFVIDQFDNKWFAITKGNKGLYYFNENGTFENTNDDVSGRLTETDGLRNNAVTSLAIDKRGELWVGTSQGLSILPNPSTRAVNPITGGPVRGQNINTIAVDPINRKWLGTNEGLFLMTSDGIQVIESFQSTDSHLPSDEINSITIDEENGLVYVGTDFGLSVLESSSIAPIQSYDELIVYPNPFYVGNSFARNLAIDGLIKNSNIKILTVNGTLVREFSTTGGRLTFWDGRDKDGEFVSSGVYIIIAYDEEVDNVTRAKVAVFNK